MKKIVKVFLLASLILILNQLAAFAGSETPVQISWGMLLINLFGGLAFFLYGMEKMSDGMKHTAGNKMRNIIGALTKNRVTALFVGAFVTMVIQSSSATTVMLVSFVQAGLMSFVQSTGVILGADIGTTITAQLIAFKFTDYALLMLAIGFSMRLFGKSENIRNIGDVVLGFGILFYGMKLMSDAMKPLRVYPEFINLLKGLENPLLGIMIGAVFTAVIQSSSAFTGIIIVLAQQGLITLDAGIPLIFGANIGTCVTAALASIGTSRDAKRVALAHVVFKIAGVMLFIFWIPQFADLIRYLALKFDSGAARQIANAHTIFNVSLGLVFLPLTGIFSKIILKILPEPEVEKGIIPATWHLDDTCISTPAIAISLARAEIARMAKLLERMLSAIIIPFMSDKKLIQSEQSITDEADLYIREIPTQDEFFPHLSLIEGLDMREEKIDFLEEKTVNYLLKVMGQRVPDQQACEIYAMISIIKDIESIGDIIHRNMLPLISKKQILETDFSDEGKEELMIYHAKVRKQVQLVREAFSEGDPETALKIMSKERKYLDLESQYRILHLERVLHKRIESIETSEVHMELMDLMKQIIVYSSNIAKTFLASCSGVDKEEVI